MTDRPRRRARLSFAALASPVVLTASFGCGDKGTTSGNDPTAGVCNVVCEPVTDTFASTDPPSTGEPPTLTTSITEPTTTDTTTTTEGTSTTATSTETGTTTTTEAGTTSGATTEGSTTGETGESTGP
ncbi:hypothetical protein [Nannocystis exedens]|uniref:hypothetical protein n=1 Tax=Nannocystis exedens TaxID=54 RepID=UPI001B80B41F|nr:hypothetical protein [Nannocystis exedens]